MSSDALKKNLTTLQQKLSANPKLDDHSRELLQKLMRDAEGLAPSSPAPALSSERDRLEALAVGFEAKHPDLAASLRELMDLLVKGGL
jgi:hypothetical protein